MRTSQVLLAILTSWVCSCTVGPDYVKPTQHVPQHFKEINLKSVKPPKHWKMAKPRDRINRGEWWLVFQDQQLNGLEKQLIHHNPSIINAAANYKNAVAIVDKARASYYPNITGAVNIIRQTLGNGTSTFASSSVQSGTTVGTQTTGLVTPQQTIRTAYVDFLNANWEPDFWGQVRRTVEADVASVQSLAALWASTRLSMEASLAQYYFQVRALDADQKWLDLIVTTNQKLLQLTRHQYQSGIASRENVVSAESQLETAQALAINNGILRSQYEHAIAALIGIPASSFSLTKKPLQASLPAIPVSIPSQWLERRPDVAEAERLMQKNNAMIGVAISAYYPSLNLSATGSGTSTNLGDFLSAPIGGWSLGLVLAQTIFDGGARSAAVRSAKALYEAQVASYRQTVLAAFQDVEDQLASVSILENQNRVQHEATQHALATLRITQNQYHAGTVAYANVLTALIAAYNAQKTEDDLIGQRMTSTVSLVKALGGGWNVCTLQQTNHGVKLSPKRKPSLQKKHLAMR